MFQKFIFKKWKQKTLKKKDEKNVLRDYGALNLDTIMNERQKLDTETI